MCKVTKPKVRLILPKVHSEIVGLQWLNKLHGQCSSKNWLNLVNTNFGYCTSTVIRAKF